MALSDNVFNFIFPCRLFCADDCFGKNKLGGGVSSGHDSGFDYNVDPIEVVKRNLKNVKEQEGVVKGAILGNLTDVEKNKYLEIGLRRYLKNVSDLGYENLCEETAPRLFGSSLQIVSEFNSVLEALGFSEEHSKKFFEELAPFIKDMYFSKIPDEMKKKMEM